MKLQAELVEVDQRNVTKNIGEVTLDKEFLDLRCLLFPDSFLQWDKTIVDKPGKRHRAVVHDPVRGAGLTDLFCDFTLRCFPSFAFRHLRFQTENHRDPVNLFFICDRIIDDFAEVSVPLAETSVKSSEAQLFQVSTET
jgi:hypothetical protein